MKWLVYLFSFYILLLSGVPCCAEDNCCEDEQTQSSAPLKKQDTNQKSTSPCSPFFSCGASHGALLQPDTESDSAAPQQISEDYPAFQDANLAGADHMIWQPPQN